MVQHQENTTKYEIIWQAAMHRLRIETGMVPISAFISLGNFSPDQITYARLLIYQFSQRLSSRKLRYIAAL